MENSRSAVPNLPKEVCIFGEEVILPGTYGWLWIAYGSRHMSKVSLGIDSYEIGDR
jgi:hypothetical protein